MACGPRALGALLALVTAASAGLTCDHLHAQSFKIVVVRDLPWLETRDMDGNEMDRAEWSGYMVHLLREVESHCPDFNYTLYLPGELSVLNNVANATVNPTSWGLATKEVIAGNGDLFWGSFYQTTQRLQYTHMTSPYMASPLSVVAAQTSKEPQKPLLEADAGFGARIKHWISMTMWTLDISVGGAAWATTFSPGMWVLALMSPFWAALVFWVLEFGHESKDFHWDVFSGEGVGEGFWARVWGLNWKAMKKQYFESVFLATGAITGSQVHRPATSHGRTFSTLWSLFCVLLYAGYTAGLTSDLVVSSAVTSVSGLQDIQARGLTVCAKGAAAYYNDYLKKEYPQIKWRPIYKGTTSEIVANLQIGGKCEAYVDTAQHAAFEIGRQCKGSLACHMAMVETFTAGYNDFAAGFRLGLSGARDEMSYILTDMRSKGKLTVIYNKWFPTYPRGQAVSATNGGEQYIPLAKLGLLFSIYMMLRKCWEVKHHPLPSDFSVYLAKHYTDKDSSDKIVVDWATSAENRKDWNELVATFLQSSNVQKCRKWGINQQAIETIDKAVAEGDLNNHRSKLKSAARGVLIGGLLTKEFLAKTKTGSKKVNPASEGASATFVDVQTKDGADTEQVLSTHIAGRRKSVPDALISELNAVLRLQRNWRLRHCHKARNNLLFPVSTADEDARPVVRYTNWKERRVTVWSTMNIHSWLFSTWLSQKKKITAAKIQNKELGSSPDCEKKGKGEERTDLLSTQQPGLQRSDTRRMAYARETQNLQRMQQNYGAFMMQNSDDLLVVARNVWERNISGVILQALDADGWEELGVKSQVDRAFLQSAVTTADNGATPQTWQCQVVSEASKRHFGRVGHWWGSQGRDSYLEQMKLLHSAVIAARTAAAAKYETPHGVEIGPHADHTALNAGKGGARNAHVFRNALLERGLSRRFVSKRGVKAGGKY